MKNQYTSEKYNSKKRKFRFQGRRCNPRKYEGVYAKTHPNPISCCCHNHRSSTLLRCGWRRCAPKGAPLHAVKAATRQQGRTRLLWLGLLGDDVVGRPPCYRRLPPPGAKLPLPFPRAKSYFAVVELDDGHIGRDQGGHGGTRVDEVGGGGARDYG